MASTISDMVSYSGNVDVGAQVTGPLFNPSLGTLTGVDLSITGSLTPDIVFGGPFPPTNPPTQSRIGYNIFGFTGLFGDTFNLTLNNGAHGESFDRPS